MCSITPETSRDISSFSHMRSPGIYSWFSDRSKYSHWILEAAVLQINPNTLTLTSVNRSLYITLLLYWSLYSFSTHVVNILTATSVVQCIYNHSCGLYCGHYCYGICVCWGYSRRLFHFSRWLGQLSRVLSKDESTRKLHLYPLGGVIYSP